MRPLLLVTALLFVVCCACKKSPDQAAQEQSGQAQPANVTGNPADGNLASAPPGSETGPAYNTTPEYDSDQDATYQTVVAPEPPPPLPDYEQPPCPGDDYVWTPGYWDYSNAGYYWVPGAWVLAPYVGALWTPAWWGFEDGHFRWHRGYWAPHIGYYGGIDYGYGYTGRGYYGAYWDHGHLDYNRSVTNVNASAIHNVYNYAVPHPRASRVSYNGGHGGVEAHPTPQELAVRRDPRLPPVAAQVQHAREASANRAQFAAHGHEQPATVVAPRPLPTGYRAPAAHPPAAALRVARQPEYPPIQEASRVAEHRATNAQSAPVQQQPRERFTPQPAPGREASPRQQSPQHPEPLPTPRAMPPARTAPESHPVTQPARPVPQSRPLEQPNPRRQEARPAPRPSRPEPETRPVPPRPAPAARFAPPPQRSAPEARPAPVPRPAQARPAPAQPRPVLEARPAPPPRPEARPAPPPQHAPQPKPAQKDERKI